MKKYFILAAVAATFAACSFDKDMGESSQTITQEEKVPLYVSTSNTIGVPAVTTRGINTNYQSDALESDNILGIYVRKITAGSPDVINTGTITESYEKDNIASTGLTSRATYMDVTTAASTLYYPDNKSQKIQIYAYAPKTIMTADATTIGDFNIDVSSYVNQGNADNANYKSSDIIWGTEGTTNEISANYYQNTAVATVGTVTGAYVGDGTNKRVVIPMKHKCSKIIVNLIPDGMDLTKLQNATVKFYVDYKNGTMNLSDGTITTYLAAGTNYQSTPVEITLADGNLGSGVTNYNDVGAYSATPSTLTGYSCCAVILPQPVNALATDNTQVQSATRKLIGITLSDGSTEYAYTTNAIHTFDAEKVYTYSITVSASGLSLSTTVYDWADGQSGTPATGGAVLQ